MSAAFGVDQLYIDQNPVAASPNAALYDITHSQIAPDLLYVHGFAFVGEGRVAGDHEAADDPRDIGRQVVGNSIGKIFLVGVAREVDKREHDKRQRRPWSAPQRRAEAGSRRRRHQFW